MTERVNNFPPIPAILRIKPCFYQNIEEEIPAPHQQLVRKVYILWMSKCSHFSIESLSSHVWSLL